MKVRFGGLGLGMTGYLDDEELREYYQEAVNELRTSESEE